jgi:hypothetical protein
MAIRKPLKKGEDVEIVPTGQKYVVLADQDGDQIRCKPKEGGVEIVLHLRAIRRVRTRATTVMIKR